MTKNVFICGSWSQREDIRSKMKELKDLGYDITHDWISTDTTPTRETRLNQAYKSMGGIKNADVVVCLVNESKQSQRTTHMAIGAAQILGKRTILVINPKQLVGEQVPCFYHHPVVLHAKNWTECLHLI